MSYIYEETLIQKKGYIWLEEKGEGGRSHYSNMQRRKEMTGTPIFHQHHFKAILLAVAPSSSEFTLWSLRWQLRDNRRWRVEHLGSVTLKSVTPVGIIGCSSPLQTGSVLSCSLSLTPPLIPVSLAAVSNQPDPASAQLILYSYHPSCTWTCWAPTMFWGWGIG